MKKNLPLIVIIASVLVTVAHFIFTEKFDRGFWLPVTSSALVIIAMVLTIRERKK